MSEETIRDVGCRDWIALAEQLGQVSVAGTNGDLPTRRSAHTDHLTARRYDPRVRIPTADEVLSGNRAALARAITAVESTRADHSKQAIALIEELLPHTGGAQRIGISGTPGVGKSTFIEALGDHLTAQGRRVAVLAVDPSSTRTGGSILGDRTRMPVLSRNPDAYIRSSPSKGNLGGVGAQTDATRLLCEAAGYDVILIETVGVGQSETQVADLTDLLLLLVAPGGGDDLQGIKRGVMEIADFIAINKADGELRGVAKTTASEYRSALSLVRPKWPDHPTEVRLCSAVTREGVSELWDAIDARWTSLATNGELERLRSTQSVSAMQRHVTSAVIQLVRNDRHRVRAEHLEAETRSGRISPFAAAALLVDDIADGLIGRP